MVSDRTKTGNVQGRIMSSHLEQADTGLDTRNNGLSEKLDLGMASVADALSAGSGVDYCDKG